MPVLVRSCEPGGLQGEDRTDLTHRHIADQGLEVRTLGRCRAGLSEIAVEDPKSALGSSRAIGPCSIGCIGGPCSPGSSGPAPASTGECRCRPAATGVDRRFWRSWSSGPSGSNGGAPAARQHTIMSAMMAPALAKSRAARAGSMAVYPRSSRRRRSSVLIAQISSSVVRSLRKLSINRATCT